MKIDKDCQSNIIRIINELSLEQFKNFCFNLLNELGLSDITLKTDIEKNQITGKATIELGIFMSYNFVFLGIQENKNITEAIISSTRKSFSNSTNKGLLLTTGCFSRNAKKQAKCKKMVPIDLIDGNNLTERLIDLNIGVNIENDKSISIDCDYFKNL